MKKLETTNDPAELLKRLGVAHKHAILIPAELEDDEIMEKVLMDDMKSRKKEFGQTMFVVMFVD